MLAGSWPRLGRTQFGHNNQTIPGATYGNNFAGNFRLTAVFQLDAGFVERQPT
jgi:hypothetical protein